MVWTTASGDIRIDKVGGHGQIDPRLVSRYRIFARAPKLPRLCWAKPFFWRQRICRRTNRPTSRRFVSSRVDETPAAISGGVAGWNSFDDVSELSRATLREAAGIRIPDSRFVAYLLGIYLLVLGPVNWSFFRLLGRVEWAWAAAPVITLASAGAVVYLAQLDIGFARSRTELAISSCMAIIRVPTFTRYTAIFVVSTTVACNSPSPTLWCSRFRCSRPAIRWGVKSFAARVLPCQLSPRRRRRRWPASTCRRAPPAFA